MNSGLQRPLLVVEIGNTTTAVAVVLEREVVASAKAPTAGLVAQGNLAALFEPFLSAWEGVADGVVCSVVPSVSAAVEVLLRARLSGRLLSVGPEVRLPFRLGYENPSSFGADRIALCACGCMSGGEEPLLLVDIGTAITFDLIGANREYLGGLILPGLELMARSLHQHTALLPQVEIARPSSLLGRSTAECIRSGIVWGCVCEVEGMVARTSRMLRDEGCETPLRVVATGGNADLVASLMEVPPELDEHAVVRGAAYLFELNAAMSS